MSGPGLSAPSVATAEPAARHRLWRLSRGFARLVAHVVWRLRIENADRVPRTGGLIIAANHVSYADPPFIGAAIPRVAYFLAKEELFRNPLFGRLIAAHHAIPIRRGQLRPEQHARVVALLKSGATLLMFPEGTRSRTGRPGRARPGVAIFARDAGVPVVPALISGSVGWTRSWLRRRPVVVRFGHPMPPPPRGADAPALRAASDQIMSRIVDLAS